MSNNTSNSRRQLGRAKRGYTFIALSSEGFDPKESTNIELLEEHALDICRWNGAETTIYKAYPAASVTIEDGTVHLQEMVLRAHGEQEALQSLLDYLNKEASYHSRMERSLIESGDYEQSARAGARSQLAMDIAKKIESLLQPDGGAPAEVTTEPKAPSAEGRAAELDVKIEGPEAKLAELEAKAARLRAEMAELEVKLGEARRMASIFTAELDLEASHPFMAACLADLREEGLVQGSTLDGDELTVWGPMKSHQVVRGELAIHGAHAAEPTTAWKTVRQVFTIGKVSK
jgi:hypothetical protein